MNSVLSVDEIDDSFFNSPAEVPFGRSQSEWARLLEEVSSTSSTPKRLERVTNQVFGDALNPPIDSVDHHAYLSSRLDTACAAVARSRESAAIARDSVCFPESQPQVLIPSQLKTPPNAYSMVETSPYYVYNCPSIATEIAGSPFGTTVTQSSASNGPFIPMMKHVIQRSAGIQVKQATSESSGEDSDDDELEGDTGTTENKDPAEEKRMRRMQSNRESARRSRSKKQEQMNELETRVGRLKVERTALLKRLTDMNHKYEGASVDNRLLKADIETLRAKVKMAEGTVKLVTGINPLLLAMSNLTADIPFVNSPIHSFPAPAAAIPPDGNNRQFFPHADSNINYNMNSHHPSLDNSSLITTQFRPPVRFRMVQEEKPALQGQFPGVPQSYGDANLKQK